MTPVLLRALAKHGVVAPLPGPNQKAGTIDLLLRGTMKRARQTVGSDSDVTLDFDGSNAHDTACEVSLRSVRARCGGHGQRPGGSGRGRGVAVRGGSGVVGAFASEEETVEARQRRLGAGRGGGGA
eukprot:5228878-Pleurochrysis_carterae.AAC.1